MATNSYFVEYFEAEEPRKLETLINDTLLNQDVGQFYLVSTDFFIVGKMNALKVPTTYFCCYLTYYIRK